MAVVSIAQPLRTLAAQGFPSEPRDAEIMGVFGTNVLLGGLTTAARAVLNGHDPARAFAIGALGGAVHVSGKLIGPVSGFPGGIPQVVLNSTGTAIVSNAGRGAGLFDERMTIRRTFRVRRRSSTETMKKKELLRAPRRL